MVARAGLSLLWRALLVAGCNQIYGLDETTVIDAQLAFFDAPVDAPPACPPLGTVPTFSRELVQAVPQSCFHYNASRIGLALAYCYRSGSVTTAYFEGRIDDEMVEVRGDLRSTNVLVRSAMLTPQGSEAYADLYDLSTSAAYVGTFRRLADGSWQRGPDTNIPTYGLALSGSWISSPTADSPRRILVRPPTTSNSIDEYGQDESGGWQLWHSYTPEELGVATIHSAQLSPDGRRLIFRGSASSQTLSRLFYADRASIQTPFAMAVPLPTVPVPPSGMVFMTEDCARVYMSALDSVFYASQL